MDILQIAGMSLTLCCLILFLKKESALFAFLVLLAGVLVLGYMIFPLLSPVLEWAEQMGQALTTGALPYLFKALGIALVTQLVQEICKDAGAGALASMVELGGRTLILLAVFPMLETVVRLVEGLLG